MSSIVISGDSSGQVSLTVPSAAGTNTATLPAATGTVMVSGNMPAFSASLSSAQTISTSTLTKVAFNTKQFDTSTAYDATTNYRFQPLVAGYYQINSMVNCISSSAINLAYTTLYKNGSVYLANSNPILYFITGSASQIGCTLSICVYLNGTDYLEIYGYNAGVTLPQFQQNSTFSGVLVRAA